MIVQIVRMTNTRVMVNNKIITVYCNHIIDDKLSSDELKALDWFLKSPLKIKSSVFDDNN